MDPVGILGLIGFVVYLGALSLYVNRGLKKEAEENE